MAQVKFLNRWTEKDVFLAWIVEWDNGTVGFSLEDDDTKITAYIKTSSVREAQDTVIMLLREQYVEVVTKLNALGTYNPLRGQDDRKTESSELPST